MEAHHFFQKALKFENNISWKAWKRKSFGTISDLLIPKKNFIFLLEKTFFFGGFGTEKNIFPTQTKFFFGTTGQKLFQSFFLFQLFKIFIITNFCKKNPKICDQKVTTFCILQWNKLIFYTDPTTVLFEGSRFFVAVGFTDREAGQYSHQKLYFKFDQVFKFCDNVNKIWNKDPDHIVTVISLLVIFKTFQILYLALQPTYFNSERAKYVNQDAKMLKK